MGKFRFKNAIIIFLVAISILLMIYVANYLISYYSHYDILFFRPIDKRDVNTTSLKPNEIADSINGVLSPIIGIIGVVLTFLAFYIQFQANKEQSKHLKFEKEQRFLDEKNKNDIEIKINKSNIRMFITYVELLLEHYRESGAMINEFLIKSKKSVFNTHTYDYKISGVYNNFRTIDFQKIYNSLLELSVSSEQEWEKKFIKTLSSLEYYEFSLNKIKNDSYKYINERNDKLHILLIELRTEIKNPMNFKIIAHKVEHYENWKIIKKLFFLNGTLDENKKEIINYDLDELYDFLKMFNDKIQENYPFSLKFQKFYNDINLIKIQFVRNCSFIEKHFNKYYLGDSPIFQIERYIEELKALIN